MVFKLFYMEIDKNWFLSFWNAWIFVENPAYNFAIRCWCERSKTQQLLFRFLRIHTSELNTHGFFLYISDFLKSFLKKQIGERLGSKIGEKSGQTGKGYKTFSASRIWNSAE